MDRTVGARGNWAISLRNLRGILERGGSSWVDDVRTPDRVENLDEIIRKAFRSAVAELETRLGPSPGNWWWGRLHTLTHVHTIGGTMPLLDRLFGFNVGPLKVVDRVLPLIMVSIHSRSIPTGCGPIISEDCRPFRYE